jgi:hypothetical protein
MTFDEWLDESEGFGGPRMLRLVDDINSPCPEYSDRIIDWLRAAYDVGHEQGRSE